MKTKITIFSIIAIMTFFGGYFVNNGQKVVTKTVKDTLLIHKTIFSTDTIIRTITNETTKTDTIEYYYNDTIQMIDTVYIVEFEKDDDNIFISGKTFYRLHSQNTFDLTYKIKPAKFSLKTYWTDGKIKSDLFRNNVKLKVDTKIEYKEYYDYVESLKPKFYEKPMFVIPITFLSTVGSIYLLNRAIK